MKVTSVETLSKKEILLIHNSSVKILEELGVIVESRNLLDILSKKGCNVDFDTMKVKFPRKVIEEAIKTIPSTVTLYNRDIEPAVILGDGLLHCVSGHNAVFMLSDRKGERREATLKDSEDFAVISDSLSEMDIIGVPVTPADVAPQTSILYSVKAILDHSKKPVLFASENEYINLGVLEMCKTILGCKSLKDRSNVICQISPTSPLYWERGAAESLYLVAKEGAPLDFIPQPITGVTAPYTLAGILTVHNTEVLSGAVIAQLVNPGIPVIYAAAWATYDMKLIGVLIGRPESSILRIAGAQMAHFYSMPSHTIAPDSDSNVMDEQNAWEKMLSTASAVMGSNDMIVNSGMFGTGMTVSFEQLVIDNEICRIVRRFARGMEVNEDTIALDTIFNVGQRGHYLTEEHTLDYLYSDEHVSLDISGIESYETWKNKGMKNSIDKASGIVKSILEKGSRNALDEAGKSSLAEIIKKYEKLMEAV